MYIESGHPGHKLRTVHSQGLFRPQRDRRGDRTPTASLGHGWAEMGYGAMGSVGAQGG